MTDLTPKSESIKTPMLNNKAYDSTKFLAQIALPALGTLYFALAGIWALPAAEQVIGTITAVDIFLGLLLGLSSKSYDNSDTKYDGVMDVTNQVDGPKVFSLQLDSDPEELEGKKAVTFKVKPS